MRLFIAINFPEEILDKIENIKECIAQYAQEGRFVSRENLHLTLEFLGEIPEEKVPKIIEVMELIHTPPFTLSLTGTGTFKRKDGEIFWLGIVKNQTLLDLQRELHQYLVERDFELEDRQYRPHITLGRKVRLGENFNPQELKESIAEIQIPVNSIELMK
ncbi:MAG: RNA 2',3'-cyclic phosphodiesterase, partial [Desulfitobacterium sp.]|nr:RNA 2',3'-cyclic phosphodiesterase [Desulfitobacterium sp.]